MDELVFLAGLTAGIAIGVPTIVRLWRVDLHDAFERVEDHS